MAVGDDRFNNAGRNDGTSPEPTIDPAELERSEEFLAALGAGVRPSAVDPAEDQLLTLLSGWRSEVEAAPLPALPSEAEIAAALDSTVVPIGAAPGSRRGWVRAGEHHHGRRPALWQAVAGAAAVATVLVGGLSIAAHSAKPGDPLWGVNKTIFADHAGDVQLVSDLTSDLEAADQAAKKGDRTTAERLLNEVSARLGEVSSSEDRVALMQRRDAIERDLSRVTPSAVPSPLPPTSPSSESSEPVVPPLPGAATLVPGTPAVPLPGNPLPVIPIPLDGLNISTTLQIPIDPQRIEDFLNNTPTRPSPDADSPLRDLRQVQPPVSPTPTAAPRPSGPVAQTVQPAPELATSKTR